jgi:mercuric ion transport protein
MSDRALIRAGMASAVLAVICCAAPLIAVSLPLAGLGAWLAGAGLVVLPLLVVGLGLVAWAIHQHRQKLRVARQKFTRDV